jgi:hypothetical protein
MSVWGQFIDRYGFHKTRACSRFSKGTRKCLVLMLISGRRHLVRPAAGWLKFGRALAAQPQFERLQLRGFGLNTGGSGGTRTHDPRFRRPMLYPLSYAPAVSLLPLPSAIY